MNGIISVLKPSGMSSGGVVGYMKKLLDVKTGHAGTLDPGAAGVLNICVGRSTRLSDYLMNSDKEYIAEALFGIATDTLDTYGNVVKREDVSVTEDMLLGALHDFRGEITQVPPAYSAVKINGRASYKLARSGQTVENRPRSAIINELELIKKTGENRFLLRVNCSKGTYIRTLIEDIGKSLKVPACTSFLMRTMAGKTHISEAFTVDEIKSMAEAGDHSFLKAPETVLSDLESVVLPENAEKRIKNGMCFTNKNDISGDFRLYIGDEFVGIGENTPEGVKLKVTLY